jgi:hypothetical protein
VRARLTWYSWKHEWVASSQDHAERALEALKLVNHIFLDLEGADNIQDMELLQHTKSVTDDSLAQLRAYHQQILAELAQEEQVVSEIEQSNPEVLQALKDSISEQRCDKFCSSRLEAQLLQRSSRGVPDPCPRVSRHITKHGRTVI